MVQVIDFLALRRRRLRLAFEPAPLPHSTREREAIRTACLIASKALQQSSNCGAPEAKRILGEAADTIAEMGNQYSLNEIGDLAIGLRTRSHRIRLPRREVRKITDIPMELIEQGLYKRGRARRQGQADPACNEQPQCFVDFWTEQ